MLRGHNENGPTHIRCTTICIQHYIKQPLYIM